MTDRFTTDDGLSLAYQVEGTGVPLLCLNGLTRNMRDFDQVAADFSGRAQVIRMDYRGRGSSDYDPNWENYSIPREAADALQLLDHLGIEKAAILGTSRGGIIAMMLALTARDRMLGAVLNDVGPELAPEGIEAIMGYLGRPPEFTSYDDAAARLVVQNAARFPDVTEAKWRIHAARVWEETPDGLALRYDPALRESLLAAVAAKPEPPWGMFEALAGMPCGLLRGQFSDLLTPETAAEMRRRVPEMLYAEVPNRGHVPFLDEAESLALINAVLDQI